MQGLLITRGIRLQNTVKIAIYFITHFKLSNSWLKSKATVIVLSVICKTTQLKNSINFCSTKNIFFLKVRII